MYIMDVLRPQIIVVGGRCYRKNPTLNRDVEADEEQEFYDGRRTFQILMYTSQINASKISMTCCAWSYILTLYHVC